MPDMPPPPPPPTRRPQSFTGFNRWAWLVGVMVAAMVVAAIVATVVSQPDPQIRYYVEPPKMEVGAVTREYVELSGRQCFSAANVRTESTEAWRFAGGSTLRPGGFDPFYRAGELTVEYGGREGAIPLDSSNCSSFVAFRQPVPTELQEDLAETCETPRMFVELAIIAVDLDTGAVSDRIVWQSESFTFPGCEES